MNVQVLDTYLCTVCHIPVQIQVVYLYTSIEKSLIIMIYIKMLVDIFTHTEKKHHCPQSTRQPAQLTRPVNQEPDKWMECRKKLE